MKDFNVYEDGNKVLTESVLNGIDVNNIIHLSVGQTFNAEEDGFLWVQPAGQTATQFSVRIDGVLLRSGTGTTSAFQTNIFIVKKGQNIAPTSSTETIIYGIKR